ncbi:MAG: GtrA family protein [Actinomycetota bacterium]|nr:GtrA family protein [Actinomycetota bacterium]MDP9020819.1 GtrA family protein [Actinomycetota bacterium]
MLAPLDATLRAQLDRKAVRYSLVSVVAVAVSQVVLLVCNGLLDWAPVPSNVTAVAIGSVPSYALNRAWVWGKRGRNDVWREVVPFWAFAFSGLAFSTLLVYLAARWSDAVLVVNAANLTAFGILWVAKYFFLDSLLFSVAGDDSELVTP